MDSDADGVVEGAETPVSCGNGDKDGKSGNVREGVVEGTTLELVDAPGELVSELETDAEGEIELVEDGETAVEALEEDDAVSCADELVAAETFGEAEVP